MKYTRMPIELESPEQLGYDTIRYNLSESSVADRRLGELKLTLDDILLCYGDHRGAPDLRGLIAGTGEGLSADDVLVTAGAAGALFIIATSMLKAGDHIVVVRPNYATNIETPRAIGCKLSLVDLTFEEGYRLDLAKIEAAIRPETKYVSVTYPHNPTGVMISPAKLAALVALVERKGIHLLFDETYREMTFGPMLPVAASLSDRVISVSSLSKTYGIPGIRIGWLISRDAALMETFLAAREQIGISGSMVDEYIAYVALSQREEWLAFNNARIASAFAIVKDWIASEPLVEWVEPSGGCVCFPRIVPSADVDLAAFHERLYSQHHAYVGRGRWFEQDDRHFRIGYAWSSEAELRQGLAAISAAIRESLRT
ncbi:MULTISPECIES: aminotransferase class I/II-fold pyridoxal phosphate-dependent enzyme [unclassified Shinella]|uniref:aminotransferase class I/II-fold pyridoxal phosphate-dependent enzyme n=1 Tax=unclassified Shinella TaxID=2643062 RepID=UPI0006814C53|nr:MULTISPECIES: aminotransferase class I/II-fold pyridoxal phosphate-dependent enzyme [unclassified Shinella]KNY16425.1 aspartate aminotransferase [Shinella sp. SUS2]KOC75344.1 aspartate aminotransferase [Shinella sp. GWS1]MCO5151508.1 aminotransferase class I/II-fold pyridoxal phosphate-dependent enzyme [Shinella sp.]MDC7266115.1 aminotransferase class I/II-fold pyridoxal phosphate-dependent enzyme [Shinella sp. HY16]MDC7273012.1 aminotransferase class I/II-fold pyridoxal phosphate-dependent